jgi:Ca-activated chloride channel family protein
MFNSKAYENSRPDGIGVMEIKDGDERRGDYPRLFVPLKRTALTGEIRGPLAALHLTQTYGYSRQQCDKVLEAVYRFPLPGDAAVTRVRVSFGEVEINAELKERKQAEADYEAARREGRQAALATRESPDVFTLHVAGIKPDQEIKVETSYVQLARSEGNGWSLRIPLTTAPRYVRSDEITSRHGHAEPLALLRDPGHRFTLNLSLRGINIVESNTHQLSHSQDGESLRVTLRDGEVIPDRDCVLKWQPQREAQRPAFQAWLHDDPSSQEVYFLAMVAPPSAPASGRQVRREAILLVDHSGSMEGAKWAAADWAVKSFLYGLSERDEFALGLFHNTTNWFERRPSRADSKMVEQAIRFLEANRDSGGTELGVALEQALTLERTKDDRARHVLVITDAEVTDGGRILRLASEESRRDNRRRISVLCIDAAPNSHLALEMAERGGGLAKFLTSDPAEEDITTALDEVLADWAEPVLPHLRLEVNRARAQAAGREAKKTSEEGWSEIDLGDLPAGRAVWVVGRVPRGKQTDLAFRVKASSDWAVADGGIELSRSDNNHPAIKTLFGARQVLGLEYLIHSSYAGQELRERLARLGYDPDQVLSSPTIAEPKVYAENMREDTHAALRNLLVREALDYGLATSETAFVAMRTEAGQVIEGSVAVANALPSGWSDRFSSFQVGGYAAPTAACAPQAMMCLDTAPPPPSSARPSAPTGSLRMPSATGSFARRVKASLLQAFSSQSASSGTDDRLAEIDAPRRMKASAVFSGTPNLSSGETILFDSSRDQARHQLPDQGTICRLALRFPDGAPNLKSLDGSLSLLIFVDDLSTPRAKVRVVDIMRQGGVRPLNLLKQPGQMLRVVLADPAGAWLRQAMRIEVTLEWS